MLEFVVTENALNALACVAMAFMLCLLIAMFERLFNNASIKDMIWRFTIWFMIINAVIAFVLIVNSIFTGEPIAMQMIDVVVL